MKVTVNQEDTFISSFS